MQFNDNSNKFFDFGIIYQAPICVCAIDGNFGLVRKKGAGTTSGASHHGDKFFLDDKHVQKFVKDYGALYSRNKVRYF